MTRDEIIRMARQAGLGFKKGSGWGTHAGTQRFAALVAAAEREACAKVCEAWAADHAKVDDCKYESCDFVAAVPTTEGAAITSENGTQPAQPDHVPDAGKMVPLTEDQIDNIAKASRFTANPFAAFKQGIREGERAHGIGGEA